MSKAFISYNFNDREIAHNVQSLLFGSNWTCNYIVLPNHSNNNDIDNEIRKQMNDSDAVVFVIGNNNHNSPWIEREAEIAISKNKKIICLRKYGTSGSPPFLLINYPLIQWDSKLLLNHLNY